EAVDHRRVRERERLADHAAHRQSHEVRTLDPEALQETEEVVCKLAQAVGTGWRARLPVAARIEAEHTIAITEGPRLLVPHGEVACERVAHRDQWSLSLDHVVDLDAVGLDLHRMPPCRLGDERTSPIPGGAKDLC